MTPQILGLRTTIYEVSDLEKAKEWYSKVFNTKPYYNEHYYIGFNIGGYELGLIPVENKTKNVQSNIISYWGVEDIDKVYSNFLQAGAKKNEAPHNVGGEIYVASIFDLWNNAIGFIYNPEFKLPN